MKTTVCLSVILLLAACGVDTASTAATAGALKKQEIEQGKQSMERLQKNLEQVNQQAAQRADADK